MLYPCVSPNDRGSLYYVQASPQVMGVLVLCLGISPSNGGTCVMSVHLPTFLYHCTSLTVSIVLWRSIPGSCQALCDPSLLLSPTSSPVSPVFLLFSGRPAYFLLLEHSTCTPTPECLYLLFLLPGMPFAQLPFPNSLGLDSAMPFKRGLPFHL